MNQFWSFGQSNNVDLVMKSIKMAFSKMKSPHKKILNSDYGFQYFYNELKKYKNKLGFRQSMSKVANSLDNR